MSSAVSVPKKSPAKASHSTSAMGNKVSLENELINLRLTSKQQQRGALKCTKNENAAKAKLREAIKAGNIEGARIYGQNAIREKNQALNCLRLSSRIDAVASRLDTAIRMKQVIYLWLLVAAFIAADYRCHRPSQFQYIPSVEGGKRDVLLYSKRDVSLCFFPSVSE